MEEIVKLLVRRDNLSYLEAENLVEECKEEISQLMNSPHSTIEDYEEVVKYWLGLEPDYLEYLL